MTNNQGHEQIDLPPMKHHVHAFDIGPANNPTPWEEEMQG
jgi:hypothetical protein